MLTLGFRSGCISIAYWKVLALLAGLLESFLELLEPRVALESMAIATAVFMVYIQRLWQGWKSQAVEVLTAGRVFSCEQWVEEFCTVRVVDCLCKMNTLNAYQGFVKHTSASFIALSGAKYSCKASNDWCVWSEELGCPLHKAGYRLLGGRNVIKSAAKKKTNRIVSENKPCLINFHV